MTNPTAAQPLDLDRIEAKVRRGESLWGFELDALIAQARAARLDTTASASVVANVAATLVRAGHTPEEAETLAAESCARATLAPVAAQQAAAVQHDSVECDSALRAEPAANPSRLDVVMLALRNARDIAMRQMVEARVPECGQFSQIAQNLDWVVGEMEQAEDARQEQMQASRCRAEGGNTSDNESSDLAAKAPAAPAAQAGPAQQTKKKSPKTTIHPVEKFAANHWRNP